VGAGAAAISSILSLSSSSSSSSAVFSRLSSTIYGDAPTDPRVRLASHFLEIIRIASNKEVSPVYP
jgi:hypothetical protein